ncbi:hypothetical protein GCM10023189_43220 [Nibrella saemangeumensis]|uniref:Uncharacterized protein n=1 Tax=Nibrella saemangeumensis TaxID=1084526 RepID=A0ABP8NDS0_9BACT
MKRHPEFEQALQKQLIVPAVLPNGEPFIRDGIQFYQAAENGLAMYQGRFVVFADITEKHDRLKLDSELLDAYFRFMAETDMKLMSGLLTMKPDEIQAILNERYILTQRNQQRLRLYDECKEYGIGSQVGRVFELASVWFFAEDEDPAVYDRDKAERFLKICYKYMELYSFFLHMQLSQFVPLAALSNEVTRKSIENLLESAQTDFLDFGRAILLSRTSGLKTATISSLESQMEAQKAYIGSYAYLLRSSTTSSAPGSESSSGT